MLEEMDETQMQKDTWGTLTYNVTGDIRMRVGMVDFSLFLTSRCRFKLLLQLMGSTVHEITVTLYVSILTS